ncbi:hypothetical protein MMC30_000474 [Trapelia coarctata]|nr:hypothetical protein [Trapelia coarctata]
MSSIRNRLLGRIWNGGDMENTTPTETKKSPRNQSLTLTNDSGYGSGGSLRSRTTTVSLSQQATTRSSEKGLDHDQQGVDVRASTSASNYSTSRQSLHKAASTTFKFFSDTIRSKTQLFYVESARPGTPYPAESGKHTKQDHKSRILSSLRSRHSRKDKGDDELEDSAVYNIVSEIPHELRIDIPDSTLLEIDSPLPKEAQYARIVSSCSAESQDAPAPADSPTQPKPFRIPSGKRTIQYGILFTVEPREPIETPGSPETSPTPNTTTSSEIDSTLPYNPSAYAVSSDGGETRDILCPFGTPQAANSTKGFRTGGNLFVKGNREQTRKNNIPSPYRRALRNSESLEVVMEHPAGSPPHAERLDAVDEVKVPVRPSIKRATSLPRGLSDIMMSDQEGTGSAEGLVTLASEGYDGDAESANELLEEATMGPRSQWDKARADRLRRYQAVRSMSSETVVDTSDEEGLQLRPYKSGQASTAGSPSSATRAIRKVRFVTSEEIEDILKPADLESMGAILPAVSPPEAEVNPYGVKITVEPIEWAKVEDIWHMANESPATENEPRGSDVNSQACSLSSAGIRYAVEAIEKPNGTSMDSSEGGSTTKIEPRRSEVSCQGRSFSGAGIRYAMEAIERPSCASLNSSEEVVESDSDCATPLALDKENQRRSSGEDFETFRVSPLRPMNARQMSSCSIATADSCAVTTSSPLCYKEFPSPCLHLHNTPVRRTSSINDEIHQVRDETGSQEPFLITPPVEKTSFGAVWSMALHPPTPMKEETTAGDLEVAEEQIDSTPGLASDKLFSNNYNASESRSSSMCAPSSDFIKPSSGAAILDSPPRAAPRESDLRPYNPQPQSSMPGTWAPEPDPPTLCIASDSGDEISSWIAEHPDSESPLEAGFGQGATDNELDFLAANPELGQYLDQAFPSGPYAAANPAYSDDEDEGFRTPMSSPLKRGQRAKRDASTRARPLSTDSELRNPVPSPQYQGEEEFVAARLPSFKSERSETSISSQPGSMDATFTSEEVLLLRDITPTGPGAARGHTRGRSWQVRDSSYGGGEFTYEAVGSPKKELQTSSVKKGVWWGRGQEVECKEEEGSPLAGKAGERDAGTERDSGKELEDESLMRIEQHLQRNRQEIEEVKAMLAEEPWNEGSRSSSHSTNETLTELQNEVAKLTGEVENMVGDKENTTPARFLSPTVDGKSDPLLPNRDPHHTHDLHAQDLHSLLDFLAPLVRLEAPRKKSDAPGLEPHQGETVVKKWNWTDEVGFAMAKGRGVMSRGLGVEYRD